MLNLEQDHVRRNEYQQMVDGMHNLYVGMRNMQAAVTQMSDRDAAMDAILARLANIEKEVTGNNKRRRAEQHVASETGGNQTDRAGNPESRPDNTGALRRREAFDSDHDRDRRSDRDRNRQGVVAETSTDHLVVEEMLEMIPAVRVTLTMTLVERRKHESVANFAAQDASVVTVTVGTLIHRFGN